MILKRLWLRFKFIADSFYILNAVLICNNVSIPEIFAFIDQDPFYLYTRNNNEVE